MPLSLEQIQALPEGPEKEQALAEFNLQNGSAQSTNPVQPQPEPKPYTPEDLTYSDRNQKWYARPTTPAMLGGGGAAKEVDPSQIDFSSSPNPASPPPVSGGGESITGGQQPGEETDINNPYSMLQNMGGSTSTSFTGPQNLPGLREKTEQLGDINTELAQRDAMGRLAVEQPLADKKAAIDAAAQNDASKSWSTDKAITDVQVEIQKRREAEHQYELSQQSVIRSQKSKLNELNKKINDTDVGIGWKQWAVAGVLHLLGAVAKAAGQSNNVYFQNHNQPLLGKLAETYIALELQKQKATMEKLKDQRGAAFTELGMFQNELKDSQAAQTAFEIKKLNDLKLATVKIEALWKGPEAKARAQELKADLDVKIAEKNSAFDRQLLGDKRSTIVQQMEADKAPIHTAKEERTGLSALNKETMPKRLSEKSAAELGAFKTLKDKFAQISLKGKSIREGMGAYFNRLNKEIPGSDSQKFDMYVKPVAMDVIKLLSGLSYTDKQQAALEAMMPKSTDTISQQQGKMEALLDFAKDQYMGRYEGFSRAGYNVTGFKDFYKDGGSFSGAKKR